MSSPEVPRSVLAIANVRAWMQFILYTHISLSVSVMQAGVTCTISNYTAWKCQLEIKNHDLAPDLVAYALIRSFSHASHQCGHGSLSSIAVYMMCFFFLRLPLSSCVVRSRLHTLHACVWCIMSLYSYAWSSHNSEIMTFIYVAEVSDAYYIILLYQMRLYIRNSAGTLLHARSTVRWCINRYILYIAIYWAELYIYLKCTGQLMYIHQYSYTVYTNIHVKKVSMCILFWNEISVCLSVKEQQKCIKSSPTQGRDEIELQANPSYVTVGAVQIQ